MTERIDSALAVLRAAADLRTQIAEANANLASSGSDLVLVQPATPPSGRFSPHPLRNLFIGSAECIHRRDAFDVAGYWNESLSRFGDRERLH